MAVQEVKKGTTLHASGDTVNSIDIILSGSFTLKSSYFSMTLTGGGIIGYVHGPGSTYSADIVAETDASVVSYPCTTEAEFLHILAATPQVLPSLALASVHTVLAMQEAKEELYSRLAVDYTVMTDDYREYPYLCPKAGEMIVNFPGLDELSAPSKGYSVPEYKLKELSTIEKNSDFMNKYFALDVSVPIATIIDNYAVCARVYDELDRLEKYAASFDIATLAFKKVMARLRTRLENKEAGLKSEQDTEIITDALNTILDYAMAGPGPVTEDEAAEFKKIFKDYTQLTDRSPYSDAFRAIRNKINNLYYKIYIAAFLHSTQDAEVPLVLKLFFNFGYIDEKLAGDENTQTFIGFLRAYIPDVKGHIFTMYEWLLKVYRRELEPGHNEFNLDYPAYLRDLKKNGEIREEEIPDLLENNAKRLEFEVKNFFSIGSRMTVSSPLSFVPFFDASNCLKNVADSYRFAMTMYQDIAKIIESDYSIFMRETIFSNPKIGINQFVYQKKRVSLFRAGAVGRCALRPVGRDRG